MGTTLQNQTIRTLSKMLQKHRASIEATGYSYDVTGNLVGRTDALSRTTTYGYDIDRQLKQIVNPVGSTWS